tara:strand:- start:1821 stop:2006 length:186 start_codon:yes stop_codon:yes gene_type:complete
MLVDVNVLGTAFEVECEMEGINSSTALIGIITIFHHGVNMTDMLNDSTIKLIENTLEEYHG